MQRTWEVNTFIQGLNLKGKCQQEKLEIDRRKTLKWVSDKQSWVIWIALTLLRGQGPDVTLVMPLPVPYNTRICEFFSGSAVGGLSKGNQAPFLWPRPFSILLTTPRTQLFINPKGYNVYESLPEITLFYVTEANLLPSVLEL